MKKYLKLKSLSWWSSVALASVQLVRAFGVKVPPEVDGIIIALLGVGLRGAQKDNNNQKGTK